MTANELQSVSVKTREYKVQDFKEITESFINVRVTPEKVDTLLKSQTVYTPKSEAAVDKVYKLWGKLYIVYKDGNVCDCSGSAEISISKAEQGVEIALYPVLYKGERGVLIHEKNVKTKVVIYPSFFTIKLPEFEYVYMLGNLFFISNKNVLTYTDQVDFSKFNGEIVLPSETGDVVGLAALDKRLVAVCERAVYLITAFGESNEFTVERAVTIDKTAEKGSVTRVLDSVVFKCGKDLYTYKNKSVTKTRAEYLEDYLIDGYACEDKGVYVLPLKKGDDKYLFRHGISDNSDALIKVDNNTATSEYMLVDNNVAVITDSSDGVGFGKGEWSSVLMDFSSQKKKTLLQMSAEVKGNVDVKVSGSAGSKTFEFNCQKNVKRPNYTSEKFRLTFDGIDFALQNLNLKYTEKGAN